MYILLYALFSLMVITVEFARDKIIKIDSLTFFSIFFLLYYLLPSLTWVLFPETFAELGKYVVRYNAAATPEVFLSLLLSYMVFAAFYLTFKRIKVPVIFFASSIGPLSSVKKRLLIVISMFSGLVVINVLLLGGVSEYVAAGLEARHNKVGYGVAGYLAYFLDVSSMMFMTFLFIFIIRKYSKLTVSGLLVVFFAAALFSIALMAKGGRTAVVEAAVYCLLFWYAYRNKTYDVKVFSTVLIVLPFLLFVVLFMRRIGANIMADNFFLDNVAMENITDSIRFSLLSPFIYFSHYLYTITEFFADPNAYGFPRLGADTLSAFILVMPGVDGSAAGLQELPDLVNQHILGKYNGYVPPGWIGWALIDGGMAYLAIKLFLAAFLLAWIDNSAKGILKIGPLGLFVYFIVLIVLYKAIFVPTAMNFVRGMLGTYLFMLLLLAFPGLRIVRIGLRWQ